MESYLIRIYRRNMDNTEGITGTIQEIVSSENRAFNSLAEMGEFIVRKGKDNRSDGKTDSLKMAVCERDSKIGEENAGN